MAEFKEILLFYTLRFCAIVIGVYIGYLLTKDVVKPKILDEYCLTDTNSCTTMEIYRYQNTFVAKEEISQVWFWYNGAKLYIFGQASGTCDQPDEFEPVNVFIMNKGDDGIVNFFAYPNECVIKIDKILSYYTNNLGVSKENLFMYRKDPNVPNNIFNIVKTMLDNKIFVL